MQCAAALCVISASGWSLFFEIGASGVDVSQDGGGNTAAGDGVGQDGGGRGNCGSTVGQESGDRCAGGGDVGWDSGETVDGGGDMYRISHSLFECILKTLNPCLSSVRRGSSYLRIDTHSQC